MLKVGVFDSGLGGLTVVKALQEVIKGATLFYIADSKNAPYGDKSSEQILQFSLDITQYFIDTHEIDALVIACNTATSAAIETLRQSHPELIIIGTEPGIKPAIEQTVTGNIGVLATPATLQGEKYQQLLCSLAKSKEIAVFEQACPGLVEQIEQGAMSHPDTHSMLEKWLDPMRENNVDTIVLGCTHYPLLANTIEMLMQNKVVLIHTGDAIANRLLSLSAKKGHINDGEVLLYIYSTGHIDIRLVGSIIHNYVLISNIKC